MLAEELRFLGLDALVGGEWRAAAQTFKLAAKLQPQRIDLFLAARASGSLVRWYSASPTSDRYRSKLTLPKGNDQNSRLARADKRWWHGDPEGALKEVDAALFLGADYAPVWILQAEIYVALNKLEDARFSGERARTLDPTSPRPYYALLKVHFLRGEKQAFAEAWKRAVELRAAPDELEYVMAICYFRAGDSPKAMGCVSRVLAINPKDRRALSTRLSLRRAASNWNAALDDVNALLELDPDLAWGMEIKADIYHEMSDEAQAVTWYTHALEFRPFKAELYRRRGNALFLLKNPKAAIGDLTRAIALEPDSGAFYCDRAAVHFEQGKYAESLRDCERALRFLPFHLATHQRRAMCLLALRRWKEAMQEIEVSERLRRQQLEVRK